MKSMRPGTVIESDNRRQARDQRGKRESSGAGMLTGTGTKGDRITICSDHRDEHLVSKPEGARGRAVEVSHMLRYAEHGGSAPDVEAWRPRTAGMCSKFEKTGTREP